MAARGKTARSAIHRDSLPVARRQFAGNGGVLERKPDVVRHEKVKMPVSVVVQKRASRTPASRARLYQSGLLGDIRERPIAIVTIQAVLPEVRAEDVVK